MNLGVLEVVEAEDARGGGDAVHGALFWQALLAVIRGVGACVARLGFQVLRSLCSVLSPASFWLYRRATVSVDLRPL